jgi:hypothetical protein
MEGECGELWWLLVIYSTLPFGYLAELGPVTKKLVVAQELGQKEKAEMRKRTLESEKLRKAKKYYPFLLFILLFSSDVILSHLDPSLLILTLPS